MENFKLAELEFHKLNFHKAIEYYFKSLEQEDLNSSDKILCCEKIISISKKIGWEVPEKIFNHLGLIYMEEGQWLLAVETFEFLLVKNKNSKNFKFLYTALLELGELRKLKKIIYQYLNFLRERKLSNQGLRFLNDLPPGILDKEKEIFFKIHFFSFMGDFESLAELCLNLSSGRKRDKVKILKVLLDLLDGYGTLWKGNKRLVENILKLLLEDDVVGSSKKERKFIIKLAFDTLFDKDLQRQGLNLIKVFAKNFKRKGLGHLASYLADDMEGLEFFSKIKEQEKFEVSHFDLGDDLDKKAEIDEKSQLEKNINFLMSVHRNKEAYGLALKLKSLDSEHPLLKKFFKEDSHNSDSVHYRKIMDDLLKEIGLYTLKREDSFEKNYQNRFKKIISTMPIQDLEKYCFDLVFALNSLEFPHISVELLNHLKRATKKGAWLLKYQYLLVETLILADRFYDALDIINDSIGNYPMMEDEKIVFIYLKGEACFNINSQREALEAFKFVDRLRPKFRLVKDRIKRLEEN